MILPLPPEWTLDAVCASVDPAVFFPRKGGATTNAKRICADCPVINECLEWALDYESGLVPGADWQASHGVYGGKSPNERRALIDQRAAELPEAS